jgi:hypothetical protein
VILDMDQSIKRVILQKILRKLMNESFIQFLQRVP